MRSMRRRHSRGRGKARRILAVALLGSALAGAAHPRIEAEARPAPPERDDVLSLDAAAGPCRVEHCDALDLASSVTLEAWVEPETLGPEGGRIIDKGTAGTKSGYMLDTFPGNSLRMIVRTRQYEAVVGFAAKLPTGRWSHVAGVFNARAGTMTLYVNGREVAARAFEANARQARNRFPLCVGSDHTGANRFRGKLDRVAVYRRALTSAEIGELAGDAAHASGEIPGRVADWSFEKLERGRYLSSAPGHLALKVSRGHRVAPAKLTGSAPPPDDPLLTPWLRQPAREWLEFRKVSLGSWASGTRINFWARLGDGEGALDILRRHLRGHVKPSLLSSFFNNDFEIDGNLGLTAGIAELLLQSHAGQIHFLAALPKAWPAGRVKGLRARGGFEVDLAWRGGELTEATLRSSKSEPCKVRYRGRVQELETEAGRSYRLSARSFVLPGREWSPARARRLSAPREDSVRAD